MCARYKYTCEKVCGGEFCKLIETVKINFGNATITVAKQSSVWDALKIAYPDDFDRFICVRHGGAILPLNAILNSDMNLFPLDYHDAEARRVYERSLRFVLLVAVHRLYQNTRLRVENSMGNGIYCTLPSLGSITQFIIDDIKQQMQVIINENLPLVKNIYSKEEAVEYFELTGQQDKVRLLKYRPFEHFQLYECDGVKDYFYGEMLPTTGCVKVYDVCLLEPGLMLMLPDPHEPNRVATYHNRPKLSHALKTTASWANILECSNTADLNGMVAKKKLREFIRINEALHEKTIAEIAEQIVKRDSRLILIAGPSSSGKTTFAHRLAIQLRVMGLKHVSVSLDDYYINREDIPLDVDGRRDLERLDTLDVALFNEHLLKLLDGQQIEMPKFDFLTGTRSSVGHNLMVPKGQPIIVEGIHGLNPLLTSEVSADCKFKIYVSALTQLNLDDHNRIRTTDVRLIRRMVRDMQFRNSPIESTLDMWTSVRRGEENYIFPYQEESDVMFNTSLQYELAILKKYIYPSLVKVDPISSHYGQASRLLKFLNYFITADVEDEIPNNSILREFIGGSCFYREND